MRHELAVEPRRIIGAEDIVAGIEQDQPQSDAPLRVTSPVRKTRLGSLVIALISSMSDENRSPLPAFGPPLWMSESWAISYVMKSLWHSRNAFPLPTILQVSELLRQARSGDAHVAAAARDAGRIELGHQRQRVLAARTERLTHLRHGHTLRMRA